MHGKSCCALQASLEVTQAAAWLDGSPGIMQQGPQTGSKLRLGTAVHKQLLAQEVNAELYLRLLCQFEPRAVLPFLQSHDSYRCVRRRCGQSHIAQGSSAMGC